MTSCLPPSSTVRLPETSEVGEDSTTRLRGVPSNFTFLQTGWPELLAEAASAERTVVIDPRASCFYARRALELTVQWMYDADASLRRPYRSDLAGLLFEPTFQSAVDARIRTKMDLVRKEGNAAVHRTVKVG